MIFSINIIIAFNNICKGTELVRGEAGHISVNYSPKYQKWELHTLILCHFKKSLQSQGFSVVHHSSDCNQNILSLKNNVLIKYCEQIKKTSLFCLVSVHGMKPNFLTLCSHLFLFLHSQHAPRSFSTHLQELVKRITRLKLTPSDESSEIFH